MPAFYGLRFKFVLAVSLILILTLVASALYLHRAQQQLLMDSLDEKASSLGQFIALISPKVIYSFDITTMDNFVEQIITDEDIHFALIRNSEGITMTTITPVGMTLEDIDDVTDSINLKGNLSLYKFPIKDGDDILGELIIAVDNSRLIKLTQDNLINLLLIDLMIIIFLGLVIFVVFHFNVLRPVSYLIHGANRASKGSLDYEVPVLSNDELGQLASCFNRMTQEIESEHIQLKQVNQNLAKEVESRKKAENRMKLTASVFTYAREGIIITDPNSKIIDVNDAFTHITGYSRQEALGKNPRFMQSGVEDEAFYQKMWNSLKQYGYWNGEIWNRRKNGDKVAELLTISAVKDSNDEIQHYVALFSDITSQKEHQKQLEHIAHYDSLTGLPNRMLLADRLHHALSQANRNEQTVTVAYLDLDGFKYVNDNYGHDLGDQLLLTIAQRMDDSLRESDTIARLGGDEFVAVLINSDRQNSKKWLERLLASAAQPVEIDNLQLQVSASIGVTMYPQGEEVDADQLLRQADQAMYRAKLEGKNKYYLFDPEADRNLRGHHENVERIRLALDNDEFTLYYQPQVNLRSGEIIGTEALIRWMHPEKGLLAPGFFLPLIEQHSLSVNIGEWVIDTALNQLQIWRENGLDMPISVNVGAYHIQQPDFVKRLNEILAKYPKLDVSRLQLEVLETSTLEIAQVSQVMHQCRNMGIEFALDDFGTGYSSLTYLKHLPASVLKIDQSFIRDMMEDPEDLAIVEGVIGLANAFRRQALAEGMETLEHGEMLLMIGCENAQGYAIARPMPADEIPHWARVWKPEESWKNIPIIHRRDQQLLFAIVEHRAWVSQVCSFLTDHQSELPETDETKCRFGRWLKNDGEKAYQSYAEFGSIKSLHQQIHQLADQMIEGRSDSESDELAANLKHLTEVREQLIGLIKKMINARQSNTVN